MTTLNMAFDGVTGLVSTGFSPAARRVREMCLEAREAPLRATGQYAWPQAQLASALDELWSETHYPDWDGHNALPVTMDTYLLARQVIQSLPARIPTPALGAEPDGQITLEWYRSPMHLLSVSIDPNGSLHYAALMGGRTEFGTQPFYGDFPIVLTELAYQIMCR